MANATDAIKAANAARAAAQNATRSDVVEAAKEKTATGTDMSKLVPLTESAAYEDASIEALPLFLPDMLNVVLKDPEYEPRWVNRKTGEGRMYRTAIARGFLPATIEDIENFKPDELIIDGGLITSDDCVLMKIQKKRLYGALKYNVQRSFEMVGRRTQTEKAAQEGVKELTALKKMPAELRNKVKMFHLSDEEAEARNTIQIEP